MDEKLEKRLADTQVWRGEGEGQTAWLRRAVPAVLCVVVIYLIFYLPHAINTDLRISEIEDSLMQVRDTMYRYQAARGVFADGPGDLDLESEVMVDPMSGERFTWLAGNADQPLPGALVWQPEPFRSRLWPFGRTMQYALFTDGSVRDFRNNEPGESALPMALSPPAR